MNITFTFQFKRDLVQLKAENSKLTGKILELIISIDENQSNPLEGIGKPERLKGNMSGSLSRRINSKHRLIYTLKKEELILLSCYGHYDDK